MRLIVSYLQNCMLPDDKLQLPGPRIDEAGPVRLEDDVITVSHAKSTN